MKNRLWFRKILPPCQNLARAAPDASLAAFRPRGLYPRTRPGMPPSHPRPRVRQHDPADVHVRSCSNTVHDVIIYLSMNSAQFGGGGNAGRGFISFNGGDTTEWFIPSGQPPTTFTEIVNSGDTGNYIMYKGVTGSSFSAEFYGHDFNHGGIAGIQIIPEPGTVTVLGIGLGALLLRRRLRKR